jgi:hypothetical protein
LGCTYALPYLTERDHTEIRCRLLDVPRELRKAELALHIVPLGEIGCDAAFQVLRGYPHCRFPRPLHHLDIQPLPIGDQRPPPLFLTDQES